MAGALVDYLSYIYNYYTRVTSFTLGDIMRLWLAPLFYLARDRRSMSIGLHVSGARPLLVRSWDGHVFIVRPGTEDLGLALLLLDRYKLEKWFMPNLGPVFVDVGAGVGGYTVRACNRSGLVVAIEPNPESRSLLAANTALNCRHGNVVIVGKAVGDRTGPAWLDVSLLQGKRVTGRGRLRLKGRRAEPGDWSTISYRVEVDTLDNILEPLGLREISLLKIDIEGSEALAIKGMEETLNITRAVMIEVKPGNTWVLAGIMKKGFRLADARGQDFLLIRAQARSTQ